MHKAKYWYLFVITFLIKYVDKLVNSIYIFLNTHVILRMGAVVNHWRCHKTSKVRCDFEIITDELSYVSLVTLNIQGSSICSPKSLYKKTSNEILAELKAVVKTGALKVKPVLPQSDMIYLLWQACVKQTALTHTPSPLRGREKDDATKMNFSSCSDHSWIKTTAIFSSLTFEFEVFLFLQTSFFTTQYVGPMVHTKLTSLSRIWFASVFNNKCII